MTFEKIERLNELAWKHRTEGLTEEELDERAELRKEYLAAMRDSLEAHLDNTYLIDENGEKQKLKKKDE
ncbi:MAG: hypothetical protein K0S60_508 [Evtepia sp.]|nr:hypothetical protein [Evtepia sp.]